MEHQTTSLFQRFLSFARDRPDIAIALAALRIIRGQTTVFHLSLRNPSQDISKVSVISGTLYLID